MRSLILAAALLLVACQAEQKTVAKTPEINSERLDEDMTALAERASPAELEVAVLNLEGGEIWAWNGEKAFPMQSVFKAPLGAAVLNEVDGGRLSLDEVIVIEEKDLSPPLSPIGQAWPNPKAYTVRDLLKRAVGNSDNTAADVLMKRIGGPGVVNTWLKDKGVMELRIDRYERELQVEANGMASFRPEWRTPEGFAAALAQVPQPERRAAIARYLEDPRDTTTAMGALNFLRMLAAGELVSPASTKLLLGLMEQTTTGQGRLKAGLPKGARLAHKTGTSATAYGVTPVTNDIGIVTLADGRSYAVAVFLQASPASLADREAILADAMRIIAKAIED